MAKTLMLNPITILSLLLLLLLSLHLHTALSFTDEEDDGEDYILDPVPGTSSARGSRFLTSVVKTIKKGTTCDAKANRYVCNGVSANNGTSILYCCKKHCRNVLGDRNNCGLCGHRCQFGERCCGGVCKNVLYSTTNCGKCGKKCSKGVKCEYGYCGYA